MTGVNLAAEILLLGYFSCLFFFTSLYLFFGTACNVTVPLLCFFGWFLQKWRAAASGI